MNPSKSSCCCKVVRLVMFKASIIKLLNYGLGNAISPAKKKTMKHVSLY